MQSVKFNPDVWAEKNKNSAVEVGRHVELRLQAPGKVEVDLGEGWRFACYGTAVRLELPVGGKVRCSEAYSVKQAVDVSVEQVGVPLTNFDKRPGTSAAEQIVKRALREAKVKEQSERLKREEADRALNALRVSKGLQEDNPLEQEVVDPPADPPAEPPVEPPADPAEPAAQ
jgi:hypothetical protein